VRLAATSRRVVRAITSSCLYNHRNTDDLQVINQLDLYSYSQKVYDSVQEPITNSQACISGIQYSTLLQLL